MDTGRWHSWLVNGIPAMNEELQPVGVRSSDAYLGARLSLPSSRSCIPAKSSCLTPRRSLSLVRVRNLTLLIQHFLTEAIDDEDLIDNRRTYDERKCQILLLSSQHWVASYVFPKQLFIPPMMPRNLRRQSILRSLLSTIPHPILNPRTLQLPPRTQ